MSDASDRTGSCRSRIPSGISDVVNAYFAPPDRQKKLRAYKLWQFWNDVVGPQISNHARPLRIREAILEVRVDQPVWMQQLQLLKPQLLKRLNDRLGEELIEDLFFRRGRLETTVEPPPVKKLDLEPLTDSEHKQIAETVAPLADAELREDLSHLLQLQKRLSKSRNKSD